MALDVLEQRLCSLQVSSQVTPHPAQRFPLADINLDDLVGPPTPGRVAYHRTLAGFSASSSVYNGSSHHPSPAPRGTEHAPAVSSGLSTVTPYNGASPPHHQTLHHSHHASNHIHTQSHSHTTSHTSLSHTARTTHTRGHEPLHHHPLTDPESVSIDEFDQLDELGLDSATDVHSHHHGVYGGQNEVEEEMFRAVTTQRSTLTPYSDPDESNPEVIERNRDRDRERGRDRDTGLDSLRRSGISAMEAGVATAIESQCASVSTSVAHSRQEHEEREGRDDDTSEDNMSISQGDSPPPEISFEEEDKFFDIPEEDRSASPAGVSTQAPMVSSVTTVLEPITLPEPRQPQPPVVLNSEDTVEEEVHGSSNGFGSSSLSMAAVSDIRTQLNAPSSPPLPLSPPLPPSILKPRHGDSALESTASKQAHLDAIRTEDGSHSKSVSFVADDDTNGQDVEIADIPDVPITAMPTTLIEAEAEADTSFSSHSKSDPNATSVDEVENAIVVDTTAGTRTATPVESRPPSPLQLHQPIPVSVLIDPSDMMTTNQSDVETESEPEPGLKRPAVIVETMVVRDEAMTTEAPSPSPSEPAQVDETVETDDAPVGPVSPPSENLASPAQKSVTLVAEGDKEEEESKDKADEDELSQNLQVSTPSLHEELHEEVVAPEPTPDPNDYTPPVYVPVVEIESQPPSFYKQFSATSSLFASSSVTDENANVDSIIGAHVEEQQRGRGRGRGRASTSTSVSEQKQKTPARPQRRSGRKSMETPKLKEVESASGSGRHSASTPSSTPRGGKGKKKATAVDKDKKASDGDKVSTSNDVEPLGPVIDEETGEVEWFIEDIVEEDVSMKRLGKRKRSHWDTMYRVRWKGYQEDVDSWMSKSELKDTEALERWLKRKKTDHTPSK